MASPVFHVREHAISCPRLPKANEVGPAFVRLAVKQYSPRTVSSAHRVAVTIVAAHANGFPKELYEPMWCHLEHQLSARGIGIHSIWMADSAFQGKSLSLNEAWQFSDLSWQDHSEDLLQLMAHFRNQMQQPIIGVGHSMGGCHIATMSVISRRIFSSMILLDPAISPPEVGLDGLGFDYMTLRRRTHWRNREAAEKSVRKMFSTWDSKVIDLFMEFAIKNDDNTASKGPSSTQSVSLVTEQYHELVNYLKPTFIHGDNTKEPELVYQTGLVDMFHMLGHITCSTFFLCGGRDTPSDDDIRDYWQTRTCALQYAKQPGERRRVDVKVLPELGHFLAMEDPKTCAEVMANWMAVGSNKWLQLEREKGGGIDGLSVNEKKALAHTWMESLRAKL